MTGRDLILYILQNNLEDKEIGKDGKFIGLLTMTEAASKFNVGIATVNAWCKLKQIDYVTIANIRYIPATAEDPRRTIYHDTK